MSLTADQLLSSFLTYIEYEKKYSNHTITSYKNDLQSFYAYITSEYELLQWGEVQTLHIRSYMATLMSQKLSIASIHRKKSALQTFYKWTMAHKHLTHNPVKLISLPTLPSRLPQNLENDAIEELMNIQEIVNNPDEWHEFNAKIISTLLFETGVRRAELTQLKAIDIDYSRKIITVLGKGNRTRQIPIRQDTLELIKSYVEAKAERYPANNTLLITPSGRDMYAQYVYRIVKDLLQNITHLKKKSPHILRHTFATELLNNGADIKAIQDLLGHKSLAATQIYTHTNIEHLKKEFRKSHPRN